MDLRGFHLLPTVLIPPRPGLRVLCLQKRSTLVQIFSPSGSRDHLKRTPWFNGVAVNSSWRRLRTLWSPNRLPSVVACAIKAKYVFQLMMIQILLFNVEISSWSFKNVVQTFCGSPAQDPLGSCCQRACTLWYFTMRIIFARELAVGGSYRFIGANSIYLCSNNFLLNFEWINLHFD